MITLLDLGIGFLQMFLGKLSNKVPAELVAAVQDAIDAIDKHKSDLITKQALEAQRG